VASRRGKLDNVTSEETRVTKWFQDQCHSSPGTFAAAEPLEDCAARNKDLIGPDKQSFRPGRSEPNGREIGDVRRGLDVTIESHSGRMLATRTAGPPIRGTGVVLWPGSMGRRAWPIINSSPVHDRCRFRAGKAHSMSYVAPRPWRHTLMLFGAYVDAKANFGAGIAGDQR